MVWFKKWLDGIYNTYLIELDRSAWSRWRNQQSKNIRLLGDGKWVEENPDPRVASQREEPKGYGLYRFHEALFMDIQDPLWLERMSATKITPLMVMRWRKSHWKRMLKAWFLVIIHDFFRKKDGYSYDGGTRWYHTEKRPKKYLVDGKWVGFWRYRFTKYYWRKFFSWKYTRKT